MTASDQKALALELTGSDGWTKFLRPDIEERIATARECLLKPKVGEDDVTLARSVRQHYAALSALKGLLEKVDAIAAPEVIGEE